MCPYATSELLGMILIGLTGIMTVSAAKKEAEMAAVEEMTITVPVQLLQANVKDRLIALEEQ
jgi:hypothetical protein